MTSKEAGKNCSARDLRDQIFEGSKRFWSRCFSNLEEFYSLCSLVSGGDMEKSTPGSARQACMYVEMLEG